MLHIKRNRRQLFLDEEVIDHLNGLKRTLHQPTKYEDNPVIVSEHPWEDAHIFLYGSVLYEDGEFKMWYDGVAHNWYRNVCYATSSDGLHWDKRLDLGTVEYLDHERTNIVLEPTVAWEQEGVRGSGWPQCSNVIADPPTDDPQHRYRMIVNDIPALRTPHGAYLATSPDGLHWTRHPGDALFNRWPMGLLWDPDRSIYVVFSQDHIVRRVRRWESSDLIDWGRDAVVLCPDADDPEGTEFHGIAPAWIDGLYVGLLHVLYADVTEPVTRHGGNMDLQLVCSRDGVRWRRVSRQPFISNGPPGDFDHGVHWGYQGPVRVGDEYFFFLSALADEMLATNTSGSIGVARLRLDGFVSLDPERSSKGTLLTKPFVFEGRELLLNIASDEGRVRVALQDKFAHGDLSGYTLDDCDPITTNAVSVPVSWNGSTDLSRFVGVAVRLLFEIEGGSLYGFQFVGEAPA